MAALLCRVVWYVSEVLDDSVIKAMLTEIVEHCALSPRLEPGPPPCGIGFCVDLTSFKMESRLTASHGNYQSDFCLGNADSRGYLSGENSHFYSDVCFGTYFLLPVADKLWEHNGSLYSKRVVIALCIRGCQATEPRSA